MDARNKPIYELGYKGKISLDTTSIVIEAMHLFKPQELTETVQSAHCLVSKLTSTSAK